MTRLWILIISALLAWPASAAAATDTLPPDNSAVGQYVESVPEAGGDHPSDSVKNGKGGGGALAPDAARALRALGADGVAAADLAASTAPVSSATDRGSGHGAGGSGRAGEGAGSKAGDPSGIGRVVASAVGSSNPGGMGVAFPLILGASLLSIALVVLLRVRQRGQGPPPGA